MRLIYLLILVAIFSMSCENNPNPYSVVAGNTFVQNESRRNDSIEWKLVWEDEFDGQLLDTTHWTKIGLYSSERLLRAFPEVKVNRNAWRKITNHWSSYMTSENSEVIKFQDSNILLRGVVNRDTSGFDNRPYHTGGIWTLNKFAFQYGRIESTEKTIVNTIIIIINY